ncbi:magnesium chelatase [Candidatus Peregrinibacteria bacterium CG_4_10_14_0_2_um_filter_38_24]|nr:MAG: magnesium chelatase [Candidatus Peregrinibacteria bacterium CG_4_10_14_0_2_um_filter_38_24]PJC38856.1 MAG: magnesium chelatase [Candidatus Peregrinibacteria bacterium CG_4_9_14_0_2_um_filter_38_9]
MAEKIYSCSFTGLLCRIIEVEADISNGMPSFSIVGLGDTSVQESKERVRLGIKNSGMEFPKTRKTINLAPAQVRKQGALFDLPIALSMLIESKQVPKEKFENSIIVGELSLTGKVNRIAGALLITQFAKEQGFEKIFLPADNASEASFIEEIEIIPIEDLKDIVEFASGKKEILPYKNINEDSDQNTCDFTFIDKIIGLEKAKRALAIGACGRHNILLHGSPGCGKTILCRAFKHLLPSMTKEEILETTKIYSVSGLLNADSPLVKSRPFREVHHTATMSSIIGGGNIPRPGEISLAHNGILFFDEIAEFNPTVLDSLRQPLEDKFINISRINLAIKFPSNFMFLATMNPCPCGFKTDKKIRCICTDTQISNYQKRLSGPLLDRFDIFVEVEKSNIHEVLEKESQQKIPQKSSHPFFMENAEKMQKERFSKSSISRNGDMDIEDIKKYCNLTQDAKDILNRAAEKLNLSNRGYLKVIKISRTIADMDLKEKIETPHILEALQYRRTS